MISWFNKKEVIFPGNDIKTDIHSHLIPGIDDGSQSMEESIALLRKFEEMGYSHLITTPHIMQDYFANTSDIIQNGLSQLRSEALKNKINLSIDAAAEYYLDEFLFEKLNKNDQLLTFGNQYLLFEMSFMSVSPYLNEFIFKLRSRGIRPILAHAERYSYYFGKVDAIEDLIERGVFIQLNINSLTGYYTKPVRKLAEQLIDRQLVHFIGTDCHRMDHLDRINEASSLKYFKKALNLPLLNRTL